MSDKQDPTPTEPVGPASGNRWEPAPGTTPDPAAPPTAAEAQESAAPAAPPTAAAATEPAPAEQRSRFSLANKVGSAGVVAGVSLGALLLGGLGGFGVGYAVGDHGGHDGDRAGHGEGPGRGGFERHGDERGFPGGDDRLAPPDQDGDGDGDQGVPDQQSPSDSPSNANPSDGQSS